MANEIKLQALEPEDLELLYEIENDPSVWQVSNLTVPYSRYALRDYICNQHHDIYIDRQLRLVIRQVSDKHEEPIGLIDLFDFDPIHMRAEVGFAVLKRFQGQGCASEALKRIVNYARLTLHLRQIYAVVPERNKASLSCLANAGFTRQATLRQWLRIGEDWQDAVFMQAVL